MEAVAKRLQFGAQLPVHISGESRPRRIIAFGGAVERDRANLRRILGGIGEAIGAGEIADTRPKQRGKAHKAAIGEHPRTRPRRRLHRGARANIVRYCGFERVAFR